MRALILCVAIGVPLVAQQPPPPAAATPSSRVLPVQGRVHLLAIPGSANVTVQIGDDGVLLVDTGAAGADAQVMTAIRTLSPRPVRVVVSTAPDPDHMGANEPLARDGGPLFASGGGGPGAPRVVGAQIFAHERAFLRVSAATGAPAPHPFGAWPTDTFVGDLKTLYMNGEPIELLHQPAAHTDGDVMVFFRGSDVISTGDLFMTDRYPDVDTRRGGTVQGVIDALNRIIRITVPAFNQQGGTRVIPGHGRIANEADVVEYRDMVTIVRDRVRALAAKGATLQQVKAAGVTADFDGLYGDASAFVDAAYAEAAAARKTRRP